VGVAEAVSLATGFGATGMDCVDNIGGTGRFIGIAGTAAGGGFRRGCGQGGRLGGTGRSGMVTVAGFLNALFGGGG
jgi:hypothetical protein